MNSHIIKLNRWERYLTSWAALVIALGLVVLISFKLGEAAKSEALHIALPSAVLVMEGYMLLRMRIEAKERAAESEERRSTIEELNAFRVALGRGQYLREIERAILAARKSVVFTSATMAMSADESGQNRILKAVMDREQATKDERMPAYKHRGIIAERGYETLPGAIELLFHTQIDLKFRGFVGVTRLRFLVRDHDFAVIGVSERASAIPADHMTDTDITKPKRTEQSFSVESAMLAEALWQRFNDEFMNETLSKDPWKHFEDFIRDVSSGSALSKQQIMSLLRANDIIRAGGTTKKTIEELKDFLSKKSPHVFAMLDDEDQPSQRAAAVD